MSAAVLLLALSLVQAPGARAGEGTLIVGLDDPEAVAELEREAVLMGATAVRCWSRPAQCHLDFAGRPPQAELQRRAGVRFVERDGLVPLVPTTAPSSGAAMAPAPAPGSDTDGTSACPDLWELETIGLVDAWAEVGGAGAGAPVVAIQDGGFRTTHDDLEGTYSGGLDYGDNDWDVSPSMAVSVPAHGTFIAGIVAGRDDNDLGRVGILSEGQLNYQKIADSSGSLAWSYAIAAMNDLADGDLGVRVLNYSIASSSYTAGFLDAVEALEDAGILLVAAAGNCGSAGCPEADNDSTPLYPASFSHDHVVAVAGSTRDDALNPYSHYGASSVDLAAPGVDICSLGIDSDTDTYTAAGTSYAAPLVAGAAALIWEAHPDLRTTEVARVLRASAHETAELQGRVQADGRLDLAAAVRTGVPRSGQPEDLVVDERADLAFEITNVGAEGEAQILVLHPEWLKGMWAEGWELTRLDPGDTVTLHDAGEHVLAGHGTLLEATLPAHSEQTVLLELRGSEVASGTASVRLVLASEGADWLNSPYAAGELDETGFLAWTFGVAVTAVEWAEDTAPPSDSDPPVDSGSEAGGSAEGGGGSGGEDLEPPGETAAGCACTGASRAAGLAWLGLFAVLAGSRRRDEPAG